MNNALFTVNYLLLQGGNYEDIKNLDNELNNNDHVKHKGQFKCSQAAL